MLVLLVLENVLNIDLRSVYTLAENLCIELAGILGIGYLNLECAVETQLYCCIITGIGIGNWCSCTEGDAGQVLKVDVDYSLLGGGCSAVCES